MRADCAVLLSLHNADAIMHWHAMSATSAEMVFQHWWHRGTRSVSSFPHAVKALGSRILDGMDLPICLSGSNGRWRYYKKLLERESDGEENWGEGKELYREGTFQCQFLTNVEISVEKHH